MKAALKLLVICTVLIFASCNNNTSSKSTEDQIKVGFVLPLSGNGGPLGEYSLNGAMLAIDEINDQGGINGKPIEVIQPQDSKSLPKEGVNIIKKMILEDPDIVYSIVSGVTMAMRPTTEGNKTILLAAVGTDKFIKGANYTLRNYISASSISQHIAPFIKDSLKSQKVGVFYANNEYNTSVKNAFVKQANEISINLGFVESFEETNRDYKSLVFSKVSKDYDCIFVDGIGAALGTIIDQIRQSGYNGKIITSPLAKAPDVITAAKENLRGVLYLDFDYFEKSESFVNNKFVREFNKAYGSNPTNFSVVSYEGMKAALNAIAESKRTGQEMLRSGALEILEGKTYEGELSKIEITGREFNFEFRIKEF